MDKCSWYNTISRPRKSQELGHGRASAEISGSIIFWCTHKHSPLSQEMAENIIGVSNRLTCEGNPDKCCIPKEQIEDF